MAVVFLLLFRLVLSFLFMLLPVGHNRKMGDMFHPLFRYMLVDILFRNMGIYRIRHIFGPNIPLGNLKVFNYLYNLKLEKKTQLFTYFKNRYNYISHKHRNKFQSSFQVEFEPLTERYAYLPMNTFHNSVNIVNTFYNWTNNSSILQLALNQSTDATVLFIVPFRVLTTPLAWVSEE